MLGSGSRLLLGICCRFFFLTALESAERKLIHRPERWKTWPHGGAFHGSQATFGSWRCLARLSSEFFDAKAAKEFGNCLW